MVLGVNTGPMLQKEVNQIIMMMEDCHVQGSVAWGGLDIDAEWLMGLDSCLLMKNSLYKQAKWTF